MKIQLRVIQLEVYLVMKKAVSLTKQLPELPSGSILVTLGSIYDPRFYKEFSLGFKIYA